MWRCGASGRDGGSMQVAEGDLKYFQRCVGGSGDVGCRKGRGCVEVAEGDLKYFYVWGVRCG